MYVSSRLKNYVLATKKFRKGVTSYVKLNFELLPFASISFAFSKVKYFLILRKAWRLYDALLPSSLMCFLKVRFLSIFIPSKGTFTSEFSDNFFNYRKFWFHVNGVNNCFIILCIFPIISVWRQSIFFPFFQIKIE